MNRKSKRERKMKHKRKYSVLKHLDFLFLDFICIELSFFLACLFRKNAFLNGIRQYLFILIMETMRPVSARAWVSILRRGTIKL